MGVLADCAASSTVVITMVDRIVKTEVDVVAISTLHPLVGLAVNAGGDELCNIIELIPDADGGSVGTRFKCSTDKSWSSKAAADVDDTFEGDGTTEYQPCSTRGVCDTSVGLCECSRATAETTAVLRMPFRLEFSSACF